MFNVQLLNYWNTKESLNNFILHIFHDLGANYHLNPLSSNNIKENR